MPKGKKKKGSKKPTKVQPDKAPSVSAMEIFKIGMNFENTIEFIESKLLDAFFGHICRQGDWDLAKQYIQNVEEWVQMLQTTVKLEYHFLPHNLQSTIIETSTKLGEGIKALLNAISTKNFDKSNQVLESILKEIRNLYKLRE
ncbi:MAG: hypothetical protein ACTSRS_13225 [Candidatus Helarchaeota archaeon]